MSLRLPGWSQYVEGRQANQPVVVCRRLDRTPNLTLLRGTSPTSIDEQLLQSVTLLRGSISQAAERIVGLREEFGISYFTLNLSPEVTWTEFEKLLAATR